MSEQFKFYAYVFLALRALIDLTVAAMIYHRVGALVVSFGFISLCCVFHAFLFFGIRNEEFRGRYGRRVILWREPFGYWFCVAFLVLFHLVITGGAIVVELAH
jgi:hypothetical protein